MHHTTAPAATPYVSAIGRAIALLRDGKRLPISLTAELREQGFDIPSLHTAHMNRKD